MNKIALVTGGSGGIGYELARYAARDGYDLILVARSADKLKQIAQDFSDSFQIKAHIIQQDLSVQGAAEKVYDEANDIEGHIEILINNAGFATFGQFTETELEPELSMMQLNMIALTHLTKLFLPDMVERGTGRIMNVASTAAFQPGPLMAVYYATKAYVLSFSEAIAEELVGTGVTVTALCPGPTETGFQSRADMEDSKLVSGRDIMSAEEVAKTGYRALMSGKRVVIPGTMNKIMATSIRFTPRKMVTGIVKKMQEREEGH
jgi:hypothetical protein